GGSRKGPESPRRTGAVSFLGYGVVNRWMVPGSASASETSQIVPPPTARSRTLTVSATNSITSVVTDTPTTVPTGPPAAGPATQILSLPATSSAGVGMPGMNA